MRAFKILGFTVLAVLALAASIGVGSASAVSLCSVNESTCPEENVYPEGTTVEAVGVGETTLTMGGITIECPESFLEAETFGSGSPTLGGEILNLAFGGCLLNAETMCAMQGINLPYEALIYQPFGGDGLLAIPMGEGGMPSLEVQCGMLTCVYGAGIKFQVSGGEGEESIPGLGLLTETLNRQAGSSFFCPVTAAWGAEYTIVEPEAVFVSQNP